MVAVEATRPGAPDVLHIASDIAVPEPQKGAVRVKVNAASVNPIDARRRLGYGRRLLSLMGAAQFPLVLGNDFAGVVDAVGPGVDGWRPGQRVFGCKGASRFGSHAQYTTVPADQLLATPGDIRDEEAASLPYAFVTAYRLLTDGLESRPEGFFGKSVLVHGGAGAVGSMAVRMLRRWGAEVTISGRHADEQCAVALGACGALDLTATRARHDAARFDAIINCASFDDEPALVPLLGHDAKGLATIVHPLISTLDAHGWVRGAIAARRIWNKRAAAVRAAGAKRYRWVMFKPTPAALVELERLLRDGVLTARIGAVYPLELAATAHRRVEQGGAPGKIVLTMPQWSS